ncbi:VanZ family protein [Segetibacter sp. 3557_3]|uniref:VanZ family protein n=1 Tax=Segetibacter sp. 3557_3 TaxID=2547429 RepID=UPI0010584703|nr:VanZ family protein [Segetibacter sp. 3557_3]TDH26446.1 VanZ family protein [Segetibacter sp. 3557_3]
MNPQYTHTVLVVILVTLPLWVLARRFVYQRQKPVSKSAHYKQELAYALLYCYFIGLVSITLLPFSKYTNSFPNRANIVPFVNAVTNLEDILKTHTFRIMLPHLVENILGNLVLLVPIGFLFPICFRYFQSFKRVIIAGFLVSFVIETLQYFLKFVAIYRSADIDDIILNTTGVALGYLAYQLLVVKKSFQPSYAENNLTT